MTTSPRTYTTLWGSIAGLTGRANATLFLAALAHLGLSAPKPTTVDRYLCARNYAPDYVAAQDEASKAWRADNADKYREYKARYKAAKPDLVKAANAAWRKANAEAAAAAGAKWRAENLDKARERDRTYQARRRATDPAFRFANNVRTCIATALSNASVSKSRVSEHYLGCDMGHFRAHIEALFVDGMTWETMGQWHLDHVRPCASFDLTNEEGRLACMNYRNWQPMWAEDNARKGALWQGRRWRHGEASEGM